MSDRAPNCTAGQSSALREAVGAYALGALDPAESDEVAAHLAECTGCRVEYAELFELLPLLASISEHEATYGPVRPESQVLGRVLATSRRAGRHHRLPRAARRTKFALATACVLLAVGGAVAGVAMSSSTHGPTPGGWSASAVAIAYPNGGSSPNITASVNVSPDSAGSRVQLRMDNVKPGYRCTMVVVATDGHAETAGTWSAPNSGTVSIPGSVSIPPEQIASIHVVLPDGTQLITINEP